MKNILLVFYHLIAPIINMTIIYIIEEPVYIYKFWSFALSMTVICSIFVANYLVTIIGREAHRSYAVLNSLIVRKRLSGRIKLKVLGLIERLSGPVIGVYCYDLFPLTNYEFYFFVLIVFQISCCF